MANEKLEQRAIQSSTADLDLSKTSLAPAPGTELRAPDTDARLTPLSDRDSLLRAAAQFTRLEPINSNLAEKPTFTQALNSAATKETKPIELNDNDTLDLDIFSRFRSYISNPNEAVQKFVNWAIDRATTAFEQIKTTTAEYFNSACNACSEIWRSTGLASIFSDFTKSIKELFDTALKLLPAKRGTQLQADQNSGTNYYVNSENNRTSLQTASKSLLSALAELATEPDFQFHSAKTRIERWLDVYIAARAIEEKVESEDRLKRTEVEGEETRREISHLKILYGDLLDLRPEIQAFEAEANGIFQKDFNPMAALDLIIADLKNRIAEGRGPSLKAA